MPAEPVSRQGTGIRVQLDGNGTPIMTREYHYTNIDETRVVIQEHSLGHKEFSAESAAGKPQFNVREYDETTGNAARTKTLYLKSVAGHDVFE